MISEHEVTAKKLEEAAASMKGLVLAERMTAQYLDWAKRNSHETPPKEMWVTMEGKKGY